MPVKPSRNGLQPRGANGVVAATLRFCRCRLYPPIPFVHPRLRSHAASVVRYPYAFASLERNDDMQPTSATQRDARSSATPDASAHAPDTAARVSLRRRAGHALAVVSMAASLSLLIAACSMPKHPDTEAPPPDPFNPAATQLLDNTEWQLSGWKLTSGSTREVPDGASGEPITLQLSTQTGQRRASGFSGCNRYTGTYMLKDGKLSFGPLAGTRMACATPGGKIEGAYLAALSHVERSGVDMRKPQQLELILDNGDTLVFARRGQ